MPGKRPEGAALLEAGRKLTPDRRNGHPQRAVAPESENPKRTTTMIVKARNPGLYRAWIDYYDNFRPEMRGYEKRTHAFFNSERGIMPTH